MAESINNTHTHTHTECYKPLYLYSGRKEEANIYRKFQEFPLTAARVYSQAVWTIIKTRVV